MARFYLYRFASACLPWLPVTAVCWRARGVPIAVALALAPAAGLLAALLGVPLSSLTERHGPRRAMVAGALVLGVGALVLALPLGIAGCVAGQIVLAVAGALDAGSDSAWLWARAGDA